MIRYRVRKVIELRDSVTGRTVTTSAVRIFTSGALKRLDKGGGLVVLMDDGREPSVSEEIRISGHTYLETGCTVEKYSVSPAQVHTIWLLPAAGYPVPVGTAAVKGKASPGTQIEIADMTDRESLKLEEDYEPGAGAVKLYHERGIDPMGKWYRAVSGGAQMVVFIGSIVEKSQDYTEYTLTESEKGVPLKSSGTVFYPMMRTYADDKGEYLAALPFVTRDGTELTMTFSVPEAGRRQEITIKTDPGKKLRIDEKEK